MQIDHSRLAEKQEADKKLKATVKAELAWQEILAAVEIMVRRNSKENFALFDAERLEKAARSIRLMLTEPPVSYKKPIPPSFKKRDIVVLDGCPFDEQIPEEARRYSQLVNVPMIVTHIKKVHAHGSSGQWVRTSQIKDWTDAAWFMSYQKPKG